MRILFALHLSLALVVHGILACGHLVKTLLLVGRKQRPDTRPFPLANCFEARAGLLSQ